MKIGGWFALIALVVLFLFYIIGPTPTTPKYDTSWPQVPERFSELEHYIEADSLFFDVKPGCEAQIHWADSAHIKTEYAVVYLHGFSACHVEGDPVHYDFANHFGTNLFLARLSDHALITDEPLVNLTVDRLWNSAREALAIGHRLGKKVILMGTSTGCTLALKLAAEYPDSVAGVINLSPNIEVNNPTAFLLNDPWGLQIARMYFGDDSRTVKTDSLYNAYWDGTYRLEAVTQLQELIETSMTKRTFRKINCPVYTGYYFRDKEHQDEVVKVSAMKRMHRQLATPPEKKVITEFPDAEAHVIGSRLYSNAYENVSKSVIQFGEHVLRLEPAREDTVATPALAGS